VVAWLAERVDKTTITRLLCCLWEAVAGIRHPSGDRSPPSPPRRAQHASEHLSADLELYRDETIHSLHWRMEKEAPSGSLRVATRPTLNRSKGSTETVPPNLAAWAAVRSVSATAK